MPLSIGMAPDLNRRSIMARADLSRQMDGGQIETAAAVAVTRLQ